MKKAITNCFTEASASDTQKELSNLNTKKAIAFRNTTSKAFKASTNTFLKF